MKYKLRATWQMSAIVEVEAEDLDTALFEVFSSSAPLPADGEYLEGSFNIDRSRMREDYPNEEIHDDYFPVFDFTP